MLLQPQTTSETSATNQSERQHLSIEQVDASAAKMLADNFARHAADIQAGESFDNLPLLPAKLH